MKKYLKYSIALVVLVSIVSCSNKRERQVQYMPDMYLSVPYDADAPKDLLDPNVSSNLKPVAGTIARGWVPYEYEDSNDGYDSAKAELKNPLEKNEANLENGEKMYTIYCVSCHGKKGDGNGWLVQKEKIGGVPAYNDAGRAITEGSIYHVLMYGKGIMGSHSSQLTYKERWQIVQYVEKLKSEL
jgi:mono/diheme cytochrome c family protein